MGNIDVAKQLLRRLRNEWTSNEGWRKALKIKTDFRPKEHESNWWEKFDKKGWSKVDAGYMTGMWRNKNGGSKDYIYLLEKVKSRDAPAYLKSVEKDKKCYKGNWWISFNRKGWSTCKDGYYMTGLYRTGDINGDNHLWNIEEAECCRPETQEEKWGHCYDQSVWSSFDNIGWSSCNADYYMVGLWRNDCTTLGCIELFKCCKMGPSNGKSWADNPKLSVKMRNLDTKQSMSCSMDVTDFTPMSDTYKCKNIDEKEEKMHLKGTKFEIEDTSEPDVLKPTPIPNFKPLICSASKVDYTCKKDYSTKFVEFSSFKVGSGYSVSATIGSEVSVETSANFLGNGVKVTAALKQSITAASSFSSEQSSGKRYEVMDKTNISVDVPAGKEVKVNIMRSKQDLEYTWKSEFEMSGKFQLDWKDDTKYSQDVATILGDKRNFFAFGKWNYPDTDFLQAIVTDKYGENLGEYCKHDTGNGSDCKIEVQKDESDDGYVGCYKTGKSRILNFSKGKGVDAAQCREICESAGFKYAGLQGKGECKCGNSGYDRYGETSGCDCENSSNVGKKKSCVYKTNFEPPSNYLGCFKEKKKNRALPKNTRVSGKTPSQCVELCTKQGYIYAGRSNNGQCWCGNKGYNKFGHSMHCDCYGKNVGKWKNCVYKTKNHKRGSRFATTSAAVAVDKDQ